MGAVTQKCGSARHRGENPAFAFDPQIGIEPTALCDEADQRFGLMDVEVVTEIISAALVVILGAEENASSVVVIWLLLLTQLQRSSLAPRSSCLQGKGIKG